MGVTNYLTVDGEILSETRNGVEHDYLPDPLGSTAALLDANGITDTFTYWPYGELRSRTGTTATPFQFVGTLGYYTDTASNRLYVRARYLRPNYGQWQTVDPLWPSESAYGYSYGNVTSRNDSSGLLSTDPFGDWIRSMDCTWKDTLDNLLAPPPAPVYGNYCGPQGADLGKAFVSKTDHCCMDHDHCFTKHNCTIKNQFSNQACKQCTNVLCTCFAAVSSKDSYENWWRHFFMNVYCRKPFTNWPNRD